jgi:RNA polymerase sigma-70 factor (ECF subfamily)
MPDLEQLQKLVAQLPAGYQQVFRLSVFEGLSHQEIGSLLGIAPHTSSSQLFHARRMLEVMIRQSWVLILLLIAIPTAVWKLLQKEEPDAVGELKPAKGQSRPQEPRPEPAVETPHDKPVYASVNKQPSAQPIHYQTEAVIQPDSIPYIKEEPQKDTLILQPKPIPPSDDAPHLTMEAPAKSSAWNIQLAYNGQIGRSDQYMAAASIGHQSFASASNTFIPTDYSFSNWIDYSWSLNNAYPTEEATAETRSLMEIAAQNAMINHGEMVAQHSHQLPFNVQLTVSRSLTSRLSIETGLSYTQMKSTVMTGSQTAYIQEDQRLRYLGIPLRFGWQWYSKAHLSLYTSAGGMLELPIRNTLNVRHVANDIETFAKETSLDVPCQWSMSLGVGLQYDLTPHVGIYLEPSLQYFFNDGSSLESYRTEHPLSITLPLGIRFHW